MKYFFTLVINLLLVSSCFALDVSIGEIKDSRTTGSDFDSYLKLDLQLVGDEIDLDNIKGVKTTIEKAVDDTGKNLINTEKTSSKFKALNKFTRVKNSTTLELKNPRRKAVTIASLSGTVEVFAPENDPESIVVVKNLSQHYGKSLPSEKLKNLGVNLVVSDPKSQAATKEKNKAALTGGMGSLFTNFMTLKPNQLLFEIEDPKGSVVSYEIQDSNGVKLETAGSMSSGGSKRLNFRKNPPKDIQLVVFVKTPKAIKKADFNLKEIRLP